MLFMKLNNYYNNNNISNSSIIINSELLADKCILMSPSQGHNYRFNVMQVYTVDIDIIFPL